MKGDSYYFPKSTHAAIPVSLYEKLVQIARNSALEGDADARRWLLDEINVVGIVAIEREFNNIKKNKDFKAKFYGKPCVICGKPADTIDHIIPISRGGNNDISNLQPMCRGCNSSKRNLLTG